MPTVGEASYERIQEGELATAAALSLPLLPLVVIAGAAGSIHSYAIARREHGRAGRRSAQNSLAELRGQWQMFLSAIMTLLAITPSLILPAISLIWLAVVAKLPPGICHWSAQVAAHIRIHRVHA